MIILAQPIFVPRVAPVVPPPPLDPQLMAALFDPDPFIRQRAAWQVEHVIVPGFTYPGYDIAPPGTPVFSGDASPTDSSADFATFMNANAGNKIALVPGRVYKMDSSLQFFNLDGWDLYGQGATVTCNVQGTGNQAWIRAIVSDNWRIRDIELIGTFDHIYYTYPDAKEDWRGFIIEGGNNVRMDRMKIRQFAGDCVYIGPRGGTGDPFDTPDGMTFVNCDFSDAGRNAVSMVGGINASFLGCRIRDGGLAAFDVEPNSSSDIVDNLLVAACRFSGGDLGESGSESHDSHGNGYPFYGSAGGAQATHHTLIGNSFDFGAIYYRRGGAPWNDNISVTNNVADNLGDCDFDTSDTNITFSNNTNITRVNH